MTRVNVSIPDEVVLAAKAAGLNVSRLATAALVEALERFDKVADLDRYLTSLDEQVGLIGDSELVSASAWADAAFGAAPTSDGMPRPTTS